MRRSHAGRGPAVAGPAAPPADAPATTASVELPLAVAAAEDPAAGRPDTAPHVQTDEEEAAEVRIVLALVGALAALTVCMGALAARGR